MGFKYEGIEYKETGNLSAFLVVFKGLVNVPDSEDTEEREVVSLAFSYSAEAAAEDMKKHGEVQYIAPVYVLFEMAADLHARGIEFYDKTGQLST